MRRGWSLRNVLGRETWMCIGRHEFAERGVKWALECTRYTVELEQLVFVPADAKYELSGANGVDIGICANITSDG